MSARPLETDLDAWFGKARDDLRAAEVMLSIEPPLLDDAAFHCQQAAEKAIKGLLVARGVPFKRVHDIRPLADTVTATDPDLEDLLDDAAELTEYAWLFRYPGEPIELTSEEVREALETARATVAVMEERARCR